MSEQERNHRPQQVTVALVAVIGGAVLLLASGFDSMANLRTVDLRERIVEALRTPSGRSFGLTVDEVIGWMHVATLVTGAAAAAAAVLGWFALQRHRAARYALAAIAVVLVVCAPFAGGLLAAFVAVAIAMLWSGPARDWFAGRPVRQGRSIVSPESERPGELARPGLPPASESSPSSGQGSSPAPTQGYGHRPTTAPVFGQQPQPWSDIPTWQPEQAPGQQPGQPAPVDRRPGGVLAACVLTWVFAGLSAMVFGLVGLVLAVRPDGVVGRIEQMPQWQDTGLSSSLIEPVLWAAVVFYLAWSLAACLLAWFTWRRQSWARVLLVVSAVGAIVLGVFALPASVLHMVVCATVVGLLLGGSSGRWFARVPQQRRTARPPQAW